jgi:hypothetical protein
MTRWVALAVVALRLAAFDDNPFNAPAVPAEYKAVAGSSRYIAMGDGARLAIDIILPKELPVNQRIPAILKITRYGRRMWVAEFPPSIVFGQCTGSHESWSMNEGQAPPLDACATAKRPSVIFGRSSIGSSRSHGRTVA